MTDSEAAVLKEVLTSYLGDLRMEITDTDRAAMRDLLKARETTLKSLIGRLTPLRTP